MATGSDDQLPLPGPDKVDCPDGCGLFGRPTRNGHVQGCDGPPGQPCHSCIGRRSRAKGKRKQRQARKLLGIPGNSMGSDEEELWRGHVRVEVKAGHRDTVPVDTRYRAMRAQSDARKAYGDTRPFGAVVMPPGTSDGIVMVRLSEVGAFAEAVVAQRTGQE
jgi:hypothetical protein